MNDTLDATVGPCIQEVRPAPKRGLEVIPCQVTRPGQLLQLMVGHCPAYGTLLWHILHPGDGVTQTVGTPEAPLRGVWYNDEVTPGNSLDPANNRKFAAFYWSFLQIGSWRLSQTWAWQLCGVFLSSTLHNSVGGLAWAYKMVLRQFFAPGGEELQHGVVIQFGGRRSARVHVAYEAFVADGESLHMTWGIKGTSGNKICMHCKNVVRANSGYAGGDYFICQSCPDYRRFDLDNDEGFYRTADIVQAAAMQTAGRKEKGLLKELEVACGMTYNAESPLYDRDLRGIVKPCSGTRYDACHVWCSNGVLQRELTSFFASAAEKLSPIGVQLGFPQLAAVCSANWRFPGESTLQKSRTIAPRMFVGRKSIGRACPGWARQSRSSRCP